MKGWLIPVIYGVVAFLAPAARAQDALYAPEAPPPVEQLAVDTTRVPPNMGAIFVPRLAVSADEPEFAVLQGTRHIADGRPGERLVVPPGSYVVELGAIAAESRVRVSVDVRSGETTLVPVTWGVLRIDVVDERLLPVRNAYELLSLQTRQSLGTGWGADVRVGERVRAWVLRPGVYRIVQPGQSYRARRGFFTVHVPAGALVRFRLVVDPITGDFLGGGVVLPDEFGSTDYGRGGFHETTYVGADLSMTHAQGVVGIQDQLTLAGDIFVESNLRYDHDAHHWFAQFEWVEGGTLTRTRQGGALPFVKTTDHIDLDTSYTYLFHDWIGPYVRVGAQMSLFPTEALTTDATTVRYVESDGAHRDVAVGANGTYRISDAFGVVQLRQSSGATAKLFDWARFSAWMTLGVGARQNLFRDNYTLQDNPATTELEWVRSDNFAQYGLEATLRVQATPWSWLMLTGDLVVFDDFKSMKDPDLDFDATATFRIRDWLSTNYIVSVRRQPRLVDTTQFEQKLLLRASVLF